MSFLIDFFRQEVPKSSRDMPDYYRKALLISEVILIIYFAASMVLILLTTHQWEWMPFAVMIVYAVCLKRTDHVSPRLNLLCFSAIIFVWLTWFVYKFGWAAGSPNILVLVLSMAFFNIYEPPQCKVGYCLVLIVFRVSLFAYSLNHTPPGTLTYHANLFFQLLNSVVPLLILAINFILFSYTLQASERVLTINNQVLYKRAGTDPLTGLPNRRALLDTIEEYRKNNSQSQFCLAIADIDFFKRVNDTYGHNCGDYTLKELARLFQESSNGNYFVCRWGGEEFCFFMPEMNLDTAGVLMQKLNSDVRTMPLHYEDVDFNITITIGAEEYDFVSTTEAILDKADRKLYMGKVGGRDRVVI